MTLSRQKANGSLGAPEMIEPVDTQDFTSQPERRKPEQFEHVKFRIDGGVARMTLNRPEHNLLNEAMLREIAGGISHAGENDDVKLIVLDSACKVFCGGIDIGEYTSQRLFQGPDVFRGAWGEMWKGERPVFGVGRGRACGGGAGRAALGDLGIATRKARFARRKISIGIFPPLASTILPFLVGPK